MEKELANGESESAPVRYRQKDSFASSMNKHQYNSEYSYSDMMCEYNPVKYVCPVSQVLLVGCA